MEASNKLAIMVEELERELKELKTAMTERRLAKIGGIINIRIDEEIIDKAKKSLFRGL